MKLTKTDQYILIQKQKDNLFYRSQNMDLMEEVAILMKCFIEKSVEWEKVKGK